MTVFFQRSNDYFYNYRYQNSQKTNLKEIFIKYEDPINPETYEAIKNLSRFLSEKEEITCKPIRYQDRKGNIFEVHRLSEKQFHRFARFLSSFFKFFKNDSSITFEVKKIKSVSEKRPVSNKDTPLVLQSAPQPILRDLTRLSFSDGYTELASKAFQQYEPEFAAHDEKGNYANSDHCCFKIIEQEGQLRLISRDEKWNDQGAALKNYIAFMVDEYGQDKIDYILHAYRINQKSGELTPEIVYRMNLGVSNLEKQDLDAFLDKLNALTSMDQLGDADIMSKFTVSELRGIQNLISEDTLLNANNLLTWIDSCRRLNLHAKQKMAVAVLSFTMKEDSKVYTGREILNPIKSKYVIADKKYYKPWIDQQELMQAFKDLKKCTTQDGKENWDMYCELLTHVVSKKHLARQHPQDQYRVGALIPAPLDKFGNQRYYVVSSFVSNGKGIHSYTLEPLNGDDDALPAIKLFRSTAHSSYAIDHSASVRNDINPFNPPGYEGANLSTQYEEEFFKQRTLPLWVGYHLQASQAVINNDKKVFLCRALDAFSRELLRPYQIKPLGAVFSQYDAELIEIAQKLLKESALNIFSVWRLIKIGFRYKKGEDLVNQKRDAAFLLSLIDQKSPRYKNLVHSLKKCMGQTDPKEIVEIKKHLATLNALRLQIENEKFEEVSAYFHSFADAVHELPKYKSHQSMILTGHSLGAACAERAYVEYTAHNERIPITAMATIACDKIETGRVSRLNHYKNCGISLRTFDAPAISASDNRLYHAYGVNVNLFTWLRTEFTVTHRIEAGDFVSQSGEEHLGASNAEEAEKLVQWTTFEATVTEGLKHTRVAHIRDTSVVHETQFEKGRRSSRRLIGNYKAYKGELQVKLSSIKEDKKEVTVEDVERILSIKKNKKIESLKRKIDLMDSMTEERKGDYERTWIDPTILKKFNQGDARSWKQLQGVFKEFGIKSTTIEKMRSLLGVVIRIFLSWLSINQEAEMHEAGHGTWWKYRDVNGVMAVNLKGVISK